MFADRERDREKEKGDDEKEEEELLKPAWIRCTHAESYYSNDPMDQVVIVKALHVHFIMFLYLAVLSKRWTSCSLGPVVATGPKLGRFSRSHSESCVLGFCFRATRLWWGPVNCGTFTSALRRSWGGDRSERRLLDPNGTRPRPNWTRIQVGGPAEGDRLDQ